MSHIAEVDILFKDLPTLAAACVELGLELKLNQNTIHSYQKHIVCTHAIAVKGDPFAYEAALTVQPDGKSYKLAFDDYGKAGQKLAAKIGTAGAKIANTYGGLTAAAKMRRRGFRIDIETNKQTGDVVVTCKK